MRGQTIVRSIMANNGMSKTLARMQLNRQADPQRIQAALSYEFQGSDHYVEPVVRKVAKAGMRSQACNSVTPTKLLPFAVNFGHVVVAESSAFFLPGDNTATDSIRIELPYSACKRCIVQPARPGCWRMARSLHVLCLIVVFSQVALVT